MSLRFPFLELGGPQGTDVYGREDGFLSGLYFNRSGAAVALGEVLMLDSTASDGDTSTYDNTNTSVQGVAISPTANFIQGLQAGLLVVVTDLTPPNNSAGTGADNSAVECALFGNVDAKVFDADGGIAIGEELTTIVPPGAVGGSMFDGDFASYERCFAIAREAQATAATSSGTAATLEVFLDNWFTLTCGVQSQGADGKTLIS